MVLCACCARKGRVEAKKYYDTSTLKLLRKETTFQTSNIQDEEGMLRGDKTKADSRHGLREAQRVGDGRKGVAEDPPRRVPFGGA